MKLVEVDLQGQEKLFWKEQASRKLIFNKIQKDKKNSLNKINQLKAASQNMQLEQSGILDLLLKPSFLDQRGQLDWPLAGEHSSKFGFEQKKNSELKMYNKGIFISASQERQAVKAIFQGQVVYAGTVSGLGHTVILDHGDHFYSVYSNASEIYVNLDEQVKKSQKIASSGESASEQKNGIYFEIRHFSEPSDPKDWMKGTAL